MKENHIIEFLENRSFASLNESDRVVIQAHTANCSSCARSYEATRIASALLRERAVEAVEPSPFFHTRVMAVLRERQNEVPAFKRLWQAAGALVSSMTATVALLAVLSFVVPGTQTSTTAQASESNGYTAEEVILNQNDLQDDHASDAQMLTTLYPAEDAAAK
jgi:predicted anti-sigma-YlaC factor YlaD